MKEGFSELMESISNAKQQELPGTAIMSQRTDLMLRKLYDQAERGCIDSLWCEEFIGAMWEKKQAGKSFTARELTKIEEMFERF